MQKLLIRQVLTKSMVWSWRFSRRQCVIYTTQRRRFVYDTWDNGSRLDRVMVECTLYITHCLRLNLQLHTIDLVRTCRISSCCTVAWQLAKFQSTRRIARSLGDSWASCFTGQMPFLPPNQQRQSTEGTGKINEKLKSENMQKSSFSMFTLYFESNQGRQV